MHVRPAFDPDLQHHRRVELCADRTPLLTPPFLSQTHEGKEDATDATKEARRRRQGGVEGPAPPPRQQPLPGEKGVAARLHQAVAAAAAALREEVQAPAVPVALQPAMGQGGQDAAIGDDSR